MSEIADWESDYSESASWNARKSCMDSKCLPGSSTTVPFGAMIAWLTIVRPINLNEGAESALKRALQNQQEFDGAVVHIISRFVAAVPEPAPAAMQYGDQHLGRLKSYRIRALKSNFAEALDRIGTFFRFAKAILRSIQRGRTIHICQLLETTDGVPMDHWLAYKQTIGSIDLIIETIH
ncbi:hypothetical protein PSTT_10499 [Puccinia striiformis]|uniref:Uncharacterized protein n=1 Tax=Puccinia striiformis TaxID=27350 RepID=A0A2S4V437_9BASI|nr:hypothetical protein PSTT_10499 [Puccinia striiformis]